MSEAQRTAMLLDWWSLDADDDEYELLPDDLKKELAHSQEPEAPGGAKQYEPLLTLALRRCYVGVTNEYLQSRLRRCGALEEVIGEPEDLIPCECCGYRTLPERGGFDICPVCFWEDDGSSDLDRVSPANHRTLRTARESFARIGAVDEAGVAKVLPDGRERYRLSRDPKE